MSSSKRSKVLKSIIILVLFTVFAMVFVVMPVYRAYRAYCTGGTEVVVITDHARTSNDNLIWVTFDDGHEEVMSVDNSIFRWHFTSNELYGSLAVGTKYEVTYFGSRRPFLGLYKNVYEATKLTR